MNHNAGRGLTSASVFYFKTRSGFTFMAGGWL